MTNRISKVIQNGTEYIVGGVDSVNGTTGAVTLKTVNNNALDGSGNISIEPGITKIFELASTSDLTTAQEAYDWFVSGKNAIIKYNTNLYHYSTSTSTRLDFIRIIGNGAQTAGTFAQTLTIRFTLSSGTVTGITTLSNVIDISSSTPGSSTTNNTITLVI